MSKIEELSNEFRSKQTANNSYSDKVEYTTIHKDALSDGDELGKGLNNESVGSMTDIKTRESLINTGNPNGYRVGGKEYSIETLNSYK